MFGRMAYAEWTDGLYDQIVQAQRAGTNFDFDSSTLS